MDNLADEVKQVIEDEVSKVNAKVGVGFKDLKSGIEVYFNPDWRFLTASVFKIFVLIELYRQVLEGKIDLNDRYTIEVYDKSPGSGVLKLLDCELNPTIRDLAKLMMIISDNTATDILIKILGKDNINRTVREVLGLNNTLIALNTKEIIFDMFELKNRDALISALRDLGVRIDASSINASNALKEFFYREVSSPINIEFLRIKCRLMDGIEASGRTLTDYGLNDYSTPRDTVKALSMLYNKEILTPELCNEIISIMAYCQTGERRLKRYLPRNVIVAHKTGTVPGVVNDVGIIFTDKRDYILAVYVNEISSPGGSSYIDVGEDLIANISRRIFEIISNYC